MDHMNEQNFGHPERGEMIIPTVNVYSSPKVSGGIYKISSPCIV